MCLCVTGDRSQGPDLFSAIYGPSSTLTEAAEIQFRSGAELDGSTGIVCLRPKPVNVVSGVSSLTSQCSVIVASYVKGSK